MAPEVVKRGIFAAPGDIWSLGIMVVEMLQKRPPYFDQGPHRAICKISNYEAPPDDIIMTGYTEELRSFLRLCLTVDVDDRITADELLEVRMSLR